MSERLVVGVDIGGTTTDVAVMRSGQLVASSRRPTVASSLVSTTAEAIAELLRSSPADGASLAAIGVGVPGQVDRASGSVRLATNLDVGTESVQVADPLADRFGVPTFVENDLVVAAVGGQQVLGAADLAVVNVGTGVAVGLVLGGRPYRGTRGLAGEVGQAIVSPAGGLSLEATIGARSVAVPEPAAVSAHLAWLAHWLALTYDVECLAFAGGPTERGDAFLDPIRDRYAELNAASVLGPVMLPPDRLQLLPPPTLVGPRGAAALAAQAAQDNQPFQEGHTP